MRCYFSDDTCAGRYPWTGSGYLPSQVSSGVLLLGVMPDGTAIWASIHCGDQTPRPLARSGVTQDKTLRLPDVSQDPWWLRSQVPAAIDPGSSPGIRTQFSDDTCAGRCPWGESGYLLSPVFSSFLLLGVMPDGVSHLGIHSSFNAERPPDRVAVGGDALGGAGLIRRSSSSIKLPSMPFHGPGQDPSGWNGVMILRVCERLTSACRSRLVESLGFERIEIDPVDQFPRKGPSPTGAGLYLWARARRLRLGLLRDIAVRCLFPPQCGNTSIRSLFYFLARCHGARRANGSHRTARADPDKGAGFRSSLHARIYSPIRAGQDVFANETSKAIATLTRRSTTAHLNRLTSLRTIVSSQVSSPLGTAQSHALIHFNTCGSA